MIHKKLSKQTKEVPTVQEILHEVKEQAKEEVKVEVEEELKKDKLHDMFYGKNWVEKAKGIIKIISA